MHAGGSCIIHSSKLSLLGCGTKYCNSLQGENHHSGLVDSQNTSCFAAVFLIVACGMLILTISHVSASECACLQDTEMYYDLKKFLEESGAQVPAKLAQHEAARTKPGAVDKPRRETTVYARH